MSSFARPEKFSDIKSKTELIRWKRETKTHILEIPNLYGTLWYAFYTTPKEAKQIRDIMDKKNEWMKLSGEYTTALNGILEEEGK